MTTPATSTSQTPPSKAPATPRAAGKSVIALALLLLAVPTVLQLTPIRTALADARVLPRPASFSTLAFAEPTSLDETVDPRGDVRFSFLASNEGEQSKTYTWTVTLAPSPTAGNPEPEAVLARSAELTLRGHQTATVPVHLRIDNCRKRNVITVALEGPDERSPRISYPVLWHGGAEWQASGGPSCG